MRRSIKYIVGIDEAGRGPLAGPVAVGLACIPVDFDLKTIPYIRDSKQLSEEKREETFAYLKKLKKTGSCDFIISMVSAPVIDRMGITKAVSLGITRGLQRLDPDPNTTFIKLDGLLKAPSTYVHQKTIVKGDQSEPEISLASIVAKVHRDRYMKRKAKLYPEYDLDVHKGYGTKAHRQAISSFGLSDMHRRTFIKPLP